MRRLVPFALIIASLGLLGGWITRADDKTAAPRPTWDPAVVELFAKLPIQDRGRIKPLSTWAAYRMLAVNGKRSHKTAWDEKLTPTVWLLDCLFYPEIARDYEIFMVQNREALDAIGLRVEGKRKRDRYSYKDLRTAQNKLDELGREYSRIADKDRSLVEGQIVVLWHNYIEYYTLDHALDFSRARFDVSGSKALSILFDGAKSVSFSQVLAKMPAISVTINEVRNATPENAEGQRRKEAELAAFSALFDEMGRAAGDSHSLAMFPPSTSRDEQIEYLTVSEIASIAVQNPRAAVKQVGFLGELESMMAHRGDSAAFKQHAEAYSSAVVALATERGEYRGIPLEVSYHRLDPFYKSLYLFGFAFILAAFSWLFPRNRWLGFLVPLGVTIPAVLLIVGIVMRCIIMQRAPITDLYETIPFITAFGVVMALVMEWMTRSRVAISMGALLGVVGMFIALKYEVLPTSNTDMKVLIAVLDTNFWLATHVTTINIGYAAGLLAAFLAHVYLLGRLFGLRKGDAAFYRTVGRMVYGVVCFCLVFATIGTILGGIWANDSWGRFWGWDPKENGALLITLWSIVILHARMGGYVRDFGICMMAVFLGITVSLSWWGVNLLGVGLHSYGFTSGIFGALATFIGIELGVMALGLLGEKSYREYSRVARSDVGAATEEIGDMTGMSGEPAG